MSPIVLFFFLGLVAGLLKCQIRFHEAVSEFLTSFLLFAIGFKGGLEVGGTEVFTIIPQLTLVSGMGFLIPLIAYPILSQIGKIGRADAASLAAHYGSVSVGTFAVCLAYLNSKNVSFEAHVPLFVVVLEIPAILVGLYIAKRASKNLKPAEIIKETGIRAFPPNLYIFFILHDFRIKVS